MQLKVRISRNNPLLALGGLGIVLFALGVMTLAFGGVALTIYGLILAFKASLLLGIIVLFVEPAPFLIGLVMFFAHTNLAERILTLFQ